MNNDKSLKVREMVELAMLLAVMLIMYQFPFLGYIPLGFMNATLMHIPVILGAVMLGPWKGAFLGFVFGLTSLMRATFQPNPTSFVFSPFYSVGEMHGNAWSLLICFVPRILVGVVAYYVYRFLKKKIKKERSSTYLALAGAGIAGSLTNTILVMNFIYFIFGSSYAEASGKVYQTLYGLILSVIVVSGIPEAIVASIIVTAVGKVLLKIKK